MTTYAVRTPAHGLFESLKEKSIHVPPLRLQPLWQLHGQAKSAWTAEVKYAA